jgi:hypothetical protein
VVLLYFSSIRALQAQFARAADPFGRRYTIQDVEALRLLLKKK